MINGVDGDNSSKHLARLSPEPFRAYEHICSQGRKDASLISVISQHIHNTETNGWSQSKEEGLQMSIKVISCDYSLLSKSERGVKYSKNRVVTTHPAGPERTHRAAVKGCAGLTRPDRRG